MTDTVFILGAGFSYDSGIPLLKGFVERMWEFSIKRKNGTSPLSQQDLKIFDDAMRIRFELDGYHGRVMFDDRNIEDILSLLSFNMLGGARKDREKLSSMNKAIARTIELSCRVEHPGVSGEPSINTTGPELYRSFWRALLKTKTQGKKFPTIITFNYDLVLERSLLQTLIGRSYSRGNGNLPARKVAVNYHYEHFPRIKYALEFKNFTRMDPIKGWEDFSGTSLDIDNTHDERDLVEIDLLKLHGSLNFPKKNAIDESYSLLLANPVSDPHILPPIFNKMTGNGSVKMWKVGLEKLREAKNVVIVGYSLPQTDIYMQYFLKAALGPNLNLNKVVVFDPVLFRDSESGGEMKNRYESCFSPQLKSRIDFLPSSSMLKNELPGSTEHFVSMLKQSPDELIF